MPCVVSTLGTSCKVVPQNKDVAWGLAGGLAATDSRIQRVAKLVFQLKNLDFLT